MKKGDRVYTQDSFGRSYIGTVQKIERVKISNRTITLVHVKDSQGKTISRNKKHVKPINQKDTPTHDPEKETPNQQAEKLHPPPAS